MIFLYNWCPSIRLLAMITIKIKILAYFLLDDDWKQSCHLIRSEKWKVWSEKAENRGNKNGKSGKLLFRKFFLSSQRYSLCNTEMTVLELSVREFTKWICHWRQHFFDTGFWNFMRIVWNQKNLDPVVTAIWEIIYFTFHIHAEDDSFLAHTIKGLPEKHTMSKIMLTFHKIKRKISFLT